MLKVNFSRLPFASLLIIEGSISDKRANSLREIPRLLQALLSLFLFFCSCISHLFLQADVVHKDII